MILFGTVIMLSCNTGQKQRKEMKELSLLDEKITGDWKMRLRYLPAAVKDTSGWNLILNIEHLSKLPQEVLNEPRFSYGVDSLFEIITPDGTLVPHIAIRVANGQVSGAEYMITFDRSVLKQASAEFRFKDWLFTRRDLFFPLNIASIHQLDSIYTRI